METNKLIINEFKELVETINFDSISSLNDEDFIHFILIFFSKINQLKTKGLQINDSLKKFMNDKYYDFSIYFDDNFVSRYEERIQDIFTELMGFCPRPIFWDTPFEEYINRKWKNRYS